MTTITTIIKRPIVLALDGALLLVGVFGKQIVAWMHAVIPDCPFYEMGILCPACGSTRAVGALVRGEIAEAFALHPYVTGLTFLCGAGLVLANLAYVFRISWAQRIGNAVFRGMTVIVLAVGYAIFGVARMLLT